MSRPRSGTVSASYSAAQRTSADRLSALQLQQQAAQAQMQRQWGSDDPASQFASFSSRQHASTLNPFDPPAAAVSAWRATPPSSSVSSSQPHTPQPPHSSRLSVAYQQAGEGYGGDLTMQPRPPAQPPQRTQRPSASAAQFQQALARSGNTTSRSSRIDEDSSSLSPRASTSSSSRAPPSSSSRAAPSILQAKVAAALQDLESIQSQTYRPATAGPSSSSSSARHGGSDGALPRPILPGHSSSGSGSGSGSSLLQMAKAAADARSAEELRTAKSLMKKLYKRNVKLMHEIKTLKSQAQSGGGQHSSQRHGADPSAAMVDDSLALESSEHTLLLEGQHDRTTDEEEEPEDEFDAAAEADDAADGSLSSRHHRPSKSKPRKKSSASTSASAAALSNGLGGSSHLLFLLGERDTSLNKQQALISTLHRKCNALQAKLDLALGHQPQHTQAAGAASNASAFAALAEAGGGGSGGGDDLSGGGGGGGGDADHHLQAQLTALRARYTDRLRSQLSSLLRSEPLPLPPAVRAYISDLESWLLWEASWRAVEKAAANARVIAAERSAQESWVARRLGESELHDARQAIQHMDAKTRSLDTQLAAALERSRK